jgi:hypothetical protein
MLVGTSRQNGWSCLTSLRTVFNVTCYRRCEMISVSQRKKYPNQLDNRVTWRMANGWHWLSLLRSKVAEWGERVRRPAVSSGIQRNPAESSGIRRYPAVSGGIWRYLTLSWFEL